MVVEPTRVVVYSTSLHMAGVAASLKADPDLEVICINPLAPDAQLCLDETNPAVIAFDLSDLSISLEATLLRERPGLLLIGVDPSSDKLLVLSSLTMQALCMADLVNVIRTKRKT